MCDQMTLFDFIDEEKPDYEEFWRYMNPPEEEDEN